ncbi:MAG: hypothetical protein HW400_418 [Candidatus Levybacteria bacterium]|nr:hypothetical protein [Candidatus Levybacteria bacterium]
MHKENGYVLSVTPEDSPNYISNEIWFGPKTNSDVSSWRTSQNFTTNGLKPFADLKSAQEAEKEMKIKLKAQKTEIIYIKLTMAENPDEIKLFEGKKDLVVIQNPLDSMDSYEIFGESTDRALHSGHIPGSFYHTNGRKPMEDYQQAVHVIQEINRQAEHPATIATLKIKKVH